ncbi:kinase [Desemzia sp. RIT804]|uniref:kinase n=1 Tax=Desemzia sp. RIT 804 TaxID=2810209 RepID=UPI00195088CC|nr:kinase [Desemzia sp. RIT 804]MBM6613851.1 kinase [Desemzia sp. RIT 804]
MHSKLIIIRGNSGSGKTSTSEILQSHLGQGTLLISQDVIRRDMLKVADREGNLSIDLIRQIAEFGKNKCKFVIVEGILDKGRYGDMLRGLIQFYNQNADIYYFDLPFEETVKRHNERPKKLEFGENSMRAWWAPRDFLDEDNEILLTSELSQEDVIDMILSQLQ